MTNHRLLCVAHYIDTHLHRPLPISELANEACMSEPNFYRTFRLIFGMTPVDYMNQKRIQLALRLLQTTSQNLTDISLACGFANVPYFTRLFRREMGVPPGQYRRRLFTH